MWHWPQGGASELGNGGPMEGTHGRVFGILIDQGTRQLLSGFVISGPLVRKLYSPSLMWGLTPTPLYCILQPLLLLIYNRFSSEMAT
jgi:hypothetical protein